MYINIFFRIFIIILMVSTANIVVATDVITDGEVIVTKAELSNAIKYWPENARVQALTDDNVKIDLLNQFLVNRKIAKKMNELDKVEEELYWQQQFAIRNIQNKLFLDHYKKTLKIPDMTELAKENLRINRDVYASSPEERKVSHILLECRAGKCDRKIKRPEARKILNQLKSGASFEDLVAKYSDDPRSKERKGKLPKWMRLGQTGVDNFFLEGAFSMPKVGDYSELVETQFGFHIIRLDELKVKTYKPDNEVLPVIISGLEKKYRNLSQRTLLKSFELSKDAKVDDWVISELLNPYESIEKVKTDEKKKVSRKTIIKKITRP